jgi:hypothetical protein
MINSSNPVSSPVCGKRDVPASPFHPTQNERGITMTFSTPNSATTPTASKPTYEQLTAMIAQLQAEESVATNDVIVDDHADIEFELKYRARLAKEHDNKLKDYKAKWDAADKDRKKAEEIMKAVEADAIPDKCYWKGMETLDSDSVGPEQRRQDGEDFLNRISTANGDPVPHNVLRKFGVCGNIRRCLTDYLESKGQVYANIISDNIAEEEAKVAARNEGRAVKDRIKVNPIRFEFALK